MARFQFVQGKKKSWWEIRMHGGVLSAAEGKGKDQPVFSFQTHDSVPLAQAAMDKLARAKLAAGFVPADKEAEAIAKRLDVAPPAPPPAPTLPHREDVYVYNEATGFVVTSYRMGGKGLESGTKKWDKAVAAGDLIPMTLVQDDPFIMRVVAGEALTPPEQDEWLAKLEWHLAVPDGKLCLVGGSEFVSEEYDESDGYWEDFIRVIPVPPGHYKATLYTYYQSVNGGAVLDQFVGGYDTHPPMGAWFRETRPGMPFPPWLQDLCIGKPRHDPGHEAEWQGKQHLPETEAAMYVCFLLHLEPSEAPAKAPKPVLEQGWFGGAEGARRPEKCPLGLAVTELHGRLERSGPAGDWFYISETRSITAPFAMQPVEGGAAVELAHLDDVFRLARYAHKYTEVNLFAMPPKGAPLEGWPPGVAAVLDGGEVRIGVDRNFGTLDLLRTLAAIGLRVADWPDGTLLEMNVCYNQPAVLRQPRPIGLQRYRGTVKGGVWTIDQAFPPVDGATLAGALALSRENALGESIRVANAAEGAAILKWAKANNGMFLDDNPPKLAGDAIHMTKDDVFDLMMIGAAAFAVRYGNTWPVMDLSDDDDAAGEQDDGMPVQGPVVLEMPGGRMYFETDATLLSDELGKQLTDTGRELLDRGFLLAGDVVCNLYANIAVRAYVNPARDTWATFLVAAPRTLQFELSSRLTAGGTSLLTTRTSMQKDDPARKTFRTILPTATLDELLKAHAERLAVLNGEFGPPVTLTPDAECLARSVEAALAKQLGG